MSSLSPLFCAVDTPSIEHARTITTAINGVCGLKLGLEFFNANGIAGIQKLLAETPDLPLFLDLKYHDIPNTVAAAIRAVTADLTPAFLNVHASGGIEMMRAAKAACPPQTKLLAVTVLTSLDSDNLRSVGQDSNPITQVLRLAELTQEAGLDGIVCSSHEIETVRQACGDDFILMVPGIRPAGSAANDQKRIMTPDEAMKKGATHLVIGRPITQSPDPQRMAYSLVNTLQLKE